MNSVKIGNNVRQWEALRDADSIKRSLKKSTTKTSKKKPDPKKLFEKAAKP
jgi:hypothetical protein